MTKVVITDHETGWRDGGESFTFRTRAAPGKGGDAGQDEYARQMHALGFVYGIYNNYTDFAPVNEFWNEDHVTRTSDGQWHTAWARCYNPKPAWAVEYGIPAGPRHPGRSSISTPPIATCTPPSRPGTIATSTPACPAPAPSPPRFYAYGEIMLHQKKTWNGPVYSEGNNHWYYCGLTDGNYGQDQAANLPENPWLVDFDLRKLHPLCCNFGMGNLDMFYRQEGSLAPRRRSTSPARPLPGRHAGLRPHGLPGDRRGHARTRPQLLQRAAGSRPLCPKSVAVEIRYADERGQSARHQRRRGPRLCRRCQIATRYSNGLEVLVNGNPADDWKTAGKPCCRPTAGACRHRDGQADQPQHASSTGHRADYVDSPAYLYADGRGRFTRFAKAACDGPLIVHWHAGGSAEVIPVGGCGEFGVALGGKLATAEALDEERHSLGPAATRSGPGPGLHHAGQKGLQLPGAPLPCPAGDSQIDARRSGAGRDGRGRRPCGSISFQVPPGTAPARGSGRPLTTPGSISRSPRWPTSSGRWPAGCRCGCCPTWPHPSRPRSRC